MHRSLSKSSINKDIYLFIMSDESHIGFNPLKNQGNNVKNEYYASYKKAHRVGLIKWNEKSKPRRY